MVIDSGLIFLQVLELSYAASIKLTDVSQGIYATTLLLLTSLVPLHEDVSPVYDSHSATIPLNNDEKAGTSTHELISRQ